MPEIRWEASQEECAVLDGYCSANGIDRSKVMRNLLHDWSEKKLNEATVILRVAGRNPVMPEGYRK